MAPAAVVNVLEPTVIVTDDTPSYATVSVNVPGAIPVRPWLAVVPSLPVQAIVAATTSTIADQVPGPSTVEPFKPKIWLVGGTPSVTFSENDQGAVQSIPVNDPTA
jgi:hypothetical protein